MATKSLTPAELAKIRYQKGISTRDVSIPKAPPIPNASTTQTKSVGTTSNPVASTPSQLPANVERPMAKTQAESIAIRKERGQPLQYGTPESAAQIKQNAATSTALNEQSMRDYAKEAGMAEKLGGLPKGGKEEALMLKSTYPQSKLDEMGYTADVLDKMINPVVAAPGTGTAPGGAAQFDASKLAELGLTPESLQKLVDKGLVAPEMLQKLMAQGQDAAGAKANLDATAKPTDSSLYVLQKALDTMQNVSNQELGTSKLFEKAGISGYATLAQSLQARKGEMTDRYNSFANILNTTGSKMTDVYNAALDSYKSTQDAYDKQVDRLLAIQKDAQDHEEALEIMGKKAELDKMATEFEYQKRAEYDKTKPKAFQFVPESENQPAGYFDQETGTFTPLSVGGNAYGDDDTPKSSYLGEAWGNDTKTASTVAVGSTGNGYNYGEPIPHGSANTLVVDSNPKLINLYKNGFQKSAKSLPGGLGGQCAAEVQQWTNLPRVGNTIKEKAASFQNFVKKDFAFYKGQGEPQVGYAVFSNDDPNYGHYWVINAKTPDGKLVASEFNRAGSRVFSNNRIVDPNDKSIIGFVKTTVKPQYQVEKKTVSQKTTDKAMQAVKNLSQGKVQGAFLDFISAGSNLLKDKAIESGKKSNQEKQSNLQKAQLEEAKKAGIVDENGIPYSPDRMAVRSGSMTDTMLNQKYASLQKLVQKGVEPPEALEAFQSDLTYGKQKAQELATKIKQDEKYSQPMNEGQSKAIGFAVSAKQAEGFLPKGGTDTSLSNLNTWINRLGSNKNQIISDKINQIQDPVAKQVAQSEMQWIANVLRGESGAAIALEEYMNAGQTYFPRPGDNAEALKRKAAARALKVENLLLMGGPQGAKYWQNLGYEVPSAVAKQYGMEEESSGGKDSLGILGTSSSKSGSKDSLGIL